MRQKEFNSKVTRDLVFIEQYQLIVILTKRWVIAIYKYLM